MTGGIYKVIGRLPYTGYKQGETFMVALDPHVEARAISRGNIQLIKRIQPSLPPGYRLPSGWAEPSEEV